jgi:CRISPR-associated exonuclease Cas4
VDITPELKRVVVETADAIRAMLASGKLPPPVNDVRCKECSLKDVCQPEALAERARLKRLHGELFNAEE